MLLVTAIYLAGIFIYVKLTPYKELELVQEGNMAAAISFSALVIGAVLGFAVFFADSVMSAFGEVAILPIILASWAVPAIVLFLGISHLARTEDG